MNAIYATESNCEDARRILGEIKKTLVVRKCACPRKEETNSLPLPKDMSFDTLNAALGAAVTAIYHRNDGSEYRYARTLDEVQRALQIKMANTPKEKK